MSALAAPPLASKIGTRAMMIAGALLVATGLAGLILVGPGIGFGAYAWALVLLGLGISPSAGVVAFAAALTAVPSKLAGTTSGTLNTFRQIGAVFGVALAGVFLSAEGTVRGMRVTFVVAAVGALLGAAAVFFALRGELSREET